MTCLNRILVQKFAYGAHGLFILLLLGAHLVFPTSVQAKDIENIFIVKHIVVRVPRSDDPAKNESTQGMLEAQKIAFKRLIQKMLTPQEQTSRNLFIKDIQRDIKDFLQRSIIVSEKQTSRYVEMTIDIHFNKEKVIQSLELAGISFCETPYPKTLLIVDDALSTSSLLHPILSAFTNAVNVYGFEIEQPIRDMEDLANLSLITDSNRREEFRTWALNRYSTQKIWKLSVDGLDSAVIPEAVPGQSMLRWKLVELGEGGLTYQFLKTSAAQQESKNKAKGKQFENPALELVKRIVIPWTSSHIVMSGLSNFLDVAVVNSDNLDLQDGLIKKFESIPGVEKVSYLEMSSDRVKLRIQYSGNEIDVKDKLAQFGAIDPGDGTEMIIRLP
ncbi:MAG: DUF2066 domain-containing protein [Magnetococcales bacterium]|nr:DUF2066 domain-containing protein [Magnetococcales bacterium]